MPPNGRRPSGSSVKKTSIVVIVVVLLLVAWHTSTKHQALVGGAIAPNVVVFYTIVSEGDDDHEVEDHETKVLRWHYTLVTKVRFFEVAKAAHIRKLCVVKTMVETKSS